MKRVARNRIYLSLLLLSGCGYAFDFETLAFVEAPGTSAGFNIQGWEWPRRTAPTAVDSRKEQPVDDDRSSSRSDDRSGNATSSGSSGSSTQSADDDDTTSSPPPSGDTDDSDTSGGGTSPAPADDDDNSSGGSTGPSLPGDDRPDRPSIPGDVGGPGLGGGVDPVGDLPPGGGFNGLF